MSSPLAQGRGLKFAKKNISKKQENVAPRAGAWIEIKRQANGVGVEPVAPRAGAWIEIKAIAFSASVAWVAPRAGAWIEIKIYRQMRYLTQSSPLAQGRGLKCLSCAHNLRH